MRQRLGLLVGPLGFISILLLRPLELGFEATAVLATTLWIVVWWVTEAVPIPVTSLLPVALFPSLGVLSISAATTPYADPIVFLLLGGFLVALSVERWNLHQRLSLLVIDAVGVGPRALVFGFMIATAVLSMWISNTATAMMMVPIGLAVLAQLESVADEAGPGAVDPEADGTLTPVLADGGDGVELGELVHGLATDPESLPVTRFGVALMLGIAYGASIGGVATLIGSPPNLVFANVAESQLGTSVGFLEWMLFGLPVAAVGLVAGWATLVLVLRPRVELTAAGHAVIREHRNSLGSLSTPEKRVLGVFGLVAAGWITRPFLIEPLAPMVTDAVIAIAGGVLAFVVPAGADGDGDRLLDWEDARGLPWGVLLLLGAGFSLATAFRNTGLDVRAAEGLSALGGLSAVAFLAVVVCAVVALTNVTSNTATASVFMPVAAAVALTVGTDPLALMAATALAASFAFVMPVATAPNAIVFSSGYLSVAEMVRVGLVVSLVGIAVILLGVTVWLPVVW